MRKPKILDLFCGAGGCAAGYSRAGFDVVGVDLHPQPYYPFEFYQADALDYLAEHGCEFDAIHASPPCQAYSVLSHLSRPGHKALVVETRAGLIASGKPYIIENVPGAPLLAPLLLCGSMFGLKTESGAQLRRHRLFETSFFVLTPGECNHSDQTIGIFGNKARDTAAEKRHYSKSKDSRGRPSGIKFSLNDAQCAMGIDWMPFRYLSQAIPPAYTEYIGKQLRAHVLCAERLPNTVEARLTAYNSAMPGEAPQICEAQTSA